jgi:hypothetical protein
LPSFTILFDTFIKILLLFSFPITSIMFSLCLEVFDGFYYFYHHLLLIVSFLLGCNFGYIFLLIVMFPYF